MSVCDRSALAVPMFKANDTHVEDLVLSPAAVRVLGDAPSWQAFTRYALPTFRERLTDAYPDLFEATNGRVRCMVCGRRGLDTTGQTSWSRHCIAGHPWICPDQACGRRFSTRQGLASHTRHVETGRHVYGVP